MIINFLLFAVLCVLCGIYLWSVRNFNYWRKKGVVYPKPSAFFGNIKEIATFKLTQAECLQQIYRKYSTEKFVGMFQLTTPTLLVRDPELVRQILVKDFHHFTDRGFVFDDVREPLTANLVNLAGNTWRLLRQKLTPTFTSAKIKQMTPLLDQCAFQFLQYLKNNVDDGDGITIEMRELTAKFTTDVIGSCAFGLQLDSFSKESVSQFRKMGHRALRPSKLTTISKLIRVFFPKLFKILNLRTFPKDVNDFFLTVVADTVSYREARSLRRNDFLQLLLDLKTSDLSESGDIDMTDNLIAAQAFVFFMAGFETSSTTLSFCLHELAANQDAQEKAVQEIRKIAKQNGHKQFDYEAVKQMEYLEACLLETMRKYPPVQALARVCTADYKLPQCQVTIEAGTAVLIPVYAIQRDEQFYPSPDAFRPERFLKGNAIAPGTYMPFGDGPRICIGMRFAMLEMKLALAKFLLHYRIKLCEKSTHPLLLDPTAFILAPKGGIWIQVQKRSQKDEEN